MSERYERPDLNEDVRSRRKKKKRKKAITLLVLEVLALVVVAGGAFLFFYADRLWGKQNGGEAVSFEQSDIKVNSDIPQAVVEASKGYTTILFYGVDARNNSALTKYANADSEIICCINNDTKEVKLVSVLRDTFLETSEGKHGKLTNIYAGYGVQESIQTFNKCFDLNITNYVTVNWKALAEAVNILGGLDVEMKNKEAKAINKWIDETSESTGISTTHVEPKGDGVYHLDGIQAVTYARIRNVVVDNEGHDIGRAHRQRKVIQLMLEKSKKADFATLQDLAETVMPGIATSFSLTDVLLMAKDVRKYDITEQTVFPFEYVDQQDLSTAYVYCNDLVGNVRKLHSFLYGLENYSPSSTVQSVSEYIDSYRVKHP